MPKYTKFTRKKYMKKYKRGRSKKGGYWLYPGPGDDVHAFTKLKDSVSSFVPSFPNLNPLSYFGKKGPLMTDASVAVDYNTPAADAVVDNTPVGPPAGQLEYPSYSANADADADAGAGAMSSPMEVAADVADADVAADVAAATGSPTNVGAPAAEVGDVPPGQAGGRRRRRRRTTKKRKRSNKRKRTMKRRRSMRRHR